MAAADSGLMVLPLAIVGDDLKLLHEQRLSVGLDDFDQQIDRILADCPRRRMTML
jgi:hypothetical protein